MTPSVNDLSRPFWTGGATGTLVFQRCQVCGLYAHPPAPVCRRCRSTSVAPESVSGNGEVLTFAINRHEWVPGYNEPYIVALVGLDEQEDLRLTTNVVGCEVDEVCIGMRVSVCFEQLGSVWLPQFRPAAVVPGVAST